MKTVVVRLIVDGAKHEMIVPALLTLHNGDTIECIDGEWHVVRNNQDGIIRKGQTGSAGPLGK